MSCRHIPSRLLTSSAEVRVPADGDYGGEYASEAATIDGVMYVASSSLDRSQTTLTDGAAGVLFVDALHSSGAFAVPVGSLVSIDGAPEVSAVSVREFRVGDDVHHWEVDVM